MLYFHFYQNLVVQPGKKKETSMFWSLFFCPVEEAGLEPANCLIQNQEPYQFVHSSIISVEYKKNILTLVFFAQKHSDKKCCKCRSQNKCKVKHRQRGKKPFKPSRENIVHPRGVEPLTV